MLLARRPPISRTHHALYGPKGEHPISSATLFRLSGLALLVALPLQVLGFVLHPPSERVVDVLQPAYQLAHLILFVSWMFALLGLMGFYGRQAERAGCWA